VGLPFTHDAHPAIADGSITVTFRAWKRAQVKVGGRYRIGPTTVEVSALAQVPASSVPEEQRRWLGDADPVWRVDFHRVEPDPPAPPLPVETVLQRLTRMDRARPWTRTVLELIRDRPAVVSTELAAAVGRERLAFKADVRKLKALGLTESLDVGYRLTPLGEQVLRTLSRCRQ
jgi:hypothetical protein